MKLKVSQVFSQRDSRWASIILGFNSATALDAYGHPYNIGWYGCLITALGIYLNDQPDNINQKLKDNGGFEKDSGNFTGKVSGLGLTLTYTSPRYEAAVTSQGIQKMKDLLDAGLPLLTEIDFNPATPGEEMHFVLVIGYGDNNEFYAADPWVGQIISLDVYGGVSRAVISFRAYDKTLPVDSASDSQSIILAQSDAFIAVCSRLNVSANKDVVLAEIEKLLGYEDAVVQKDKKISDLQTSIDDLDKQISEKDGELETLQGNQEDMQKQIDTAVAGQKTLQDQISQLKEQLKAPQLTGWRLFIYRIITKGVN